MHMLCPRPFVLLGVVGVVLTSNPALAQHTHAPSPAPAQHEHQPTGDAVSLFAPRDASGTAWLPDVTPMYGVQRSWGRWQVMLHGLAFAQFLYEPGDIHRTGGFSTHQFGSVNWGMLMARRPAGAGRVGVRAMLSAEPWSVAGCGYLNQLATGEMCEGDTIHDRQHPHDLFMELAGDYDRPVRGSVRWQVYAGLAGEPAIGPAGFPHRVSATPNPIAPIAHHWIDATHVTFGLVTTGVYDRRWKAEVSVFNGREPDENRADLDLGPLDSVSARLSFLPTDTLAFQVSAGHLNDAEAGFPPEPRSDVTRATTSATYHRPLSEGGMWATTIALGMNSARETIPDGEFQADTFALLLETAVSARDRQTWFGRAEIVEKPAHDLHAHEYGASVFTVGKLQGGYVRYFAARKGVVPGIGGTVSAGVVPRELTRGYYRRVEPGFGVFFTLRPVRHVM
jgi:hypothetical protein